MWYRTGTVNIANGATAVTGITTGWLNQVKAGDAITFDGGGKWYEIAATPSTNTALTLVTPFAEATISGGVYAIDRRGPLWSPSLEIASQVAALLDRLSGVGTYLSSTVLVASHVALVSLVPKTVMSLALPAGEWDVDLAMYFDGSATGSLAASGVHTSTDAFDYTGVGRFTMSFLSGSGIAVGPVVRCGPARFVVAVPTTIYGVAMAQFSSGTAFGYGTLRARRWA